MLDPRHDECDAKHGEQPVPNPERPVLPFRKIPAIEICVDAAFLDHLVRDLPQAEQPAFIRRLWRQEAECVGILGIARMQPGAFDQRRIEPGLGGKAVDP